MCVFVCVCVYNTTQYRETSTPGDFLGKLAVWLVSEESSLQGKSQPWEGLSRPGSG